MLIENSSTVSRDPSQQGDFKGVAPFGVFDPEKRQLADYYRERSIIEQGADKSGTRVTSHLSVVKYPRSVGNSFMVTNQDGVNRTANNIQSYPFVVTQQDMDGL